MVPQRWLVAGFLLLAALSLLVAAEQSHSEFASELQSSEGLLQEQEASQALSVESAHTDVPALLESEAQRRGGGGGGGRRGGGGGGGHRHHHVRHHWGGGGGRRHHHVRHWGGGGRHHHRRHHWGGGGHRHHGRRHHRHHWGHGGHRRHRWGGHGHHRKHRWGHGGRHHRKHWWGGRGGRHHRRHRWGGHGKHRGGRGGGGGGGGGGSRGNGIQVPLLVHLENIGDRRFSGFAGSRGQSRRLEGFAVMSDGMPAGVSIRYSVRFADGQESGSTPMGSFAGSRGQSRALSGFTAWLEGANAAQYTLNYYAHVQNVGDTPVSHSGQFCGVRQALRMEGLEMWLTRVHAPSRWVKPTGPDNAREQINNLYKTLLCREGEPGGLHGWTHALRSGRSLEWIRAQFIASPEYRGKNPGGVFRGCGDVNQYREQVKALYREILCREGEPAGVRGWTSALMNGQTLAQVRQQFLTSAEYNARPVKACAAPTDYTGQIKQLYRSILCREGEPAGVSYWSNVARNGEAIPSIARRFRQGAEYLQKNPGGVFRGCGGTPPPKPPAPPAKPAVPRGTPPVAPLVTPLTCPVGYKNPAITDAGYLHDRQWVDLCQRGAKKDYGRWVGVGAGIWYSIALADCPDQYSKRGEWVLRNGVVQPGPNYKGCGCSRHNIDVTVSPHGYRNKYITDWGYGHQRRWVDLRGVGQKNDYCRWVGVGPNIWYSCAIYECPNQYSLRNEFIWRDNQPQRGPAFHGFDCNRNNAKRVWAPAPGAPWRAPVPQQKHYDGLRTALGRSGPAQLSCPAGQNINVKDASWGVGRGVYQASGYINKGSCETSGGHAAAVKQCNNKPSCSLDGSAFASTQCGGDKKEVFVVYSCTVAPAPTQPVPPVQTQQEYAGVRMSLFKPGQASVLTCPGEKRIRLLDASFGVNQGFYKSTGYIRRGSCHAPESWDLVKGCHDKSSCDLAGKFAQAQCHEQAGAAIKVTYTCVRNPPPVAVPAPAKPAPRQFKYVPQPMPRVNPQPSKIPDKPVPAPPGAKAAAKKAKQVAAAKKAEKAAAAQAAPGNSEIIVHLTQLAPPEPNAAALNHVEKKLDRLHKKAMTKIEGLLSDLESRRKAKKPCLKKLQRTIKKFKRAFVREAQAVEKITHKYSYADDAPTLV